MGNGRTVGATSGRTQWLKYQIGTFRNFSEQKIDNREQTLVLLRSST